MNGPWKARWSSAASILTVPRGNSWDKTKTASAESLLSLRDKTTPSLEDALARMDKPGDLLIACGTRAFNVHWRIVCPQSTFFHKASSNGFAESRNGAIHLPDDDVETVERMLQFFYLGEYTEEAWNPEVTLEESIQTEPALWSSVRLYALGSKYLIPKIQEVAKTNFQFWASRRWMHPDFLYMVREIWDPAKCVESDWGLQDAARQVCVGNLEGLLFRAAERQEEVVRERDHLRTMVASLQVQVGGLTAQVRRSDRNQFFPGHRKNRSYS